MGGARLHVMGVASYVLMSIWRIDHVSRIRRVGWVRLHRVGVASSLHVIRGYVVGVVYSMNYRRRGVIPITARLWRIEVGLHTVAAIDVRETGMGGA